MLKQSLVLFWTALTMMSSVVQAQIVESAYQSALESCRELLALDLGGERKVIAPLFFRSPLGVVEFYSDGFVRASHPKTSEVWLEAEWEPAALKYSRRRAVRPSLMDRYYGVSGGRRLLLHEEKEVLGAFPFYGKIYLVTNAGISSIQPLRRGPIRDRWRSFVYARRTGVATQMEHLFREYRNEFNGKAEAEREYPVALNAEAFVVRAVRKDEVEVSVLLGSSIQHFRIAHDRVDRIPASWDSSSNMKIEKGGLLREYRAMLSRDPYR